MSARTLKRLKTGVAILLLPLCFGTGQAVLHLFRAAGPADSLWVPVVAGAACWLVVYLTLPEPMRIYVFGHELTHALSVWLLGGKVKGFKASAKGGHVVVNRRNFFVALAPYFFPIYAAAVVLVFLAGQWFWEWRQCLPWFHLLVGAAYAFHATFTWRVLKARQSDIVEQGCLFSAVVIWLGNAGVLVVGIPLLTGRVGVLTALGWCCLETGQVFEKLGGIL